MLIPWTPIAGPLCYLASPFTRYRLGHERAVADIARIAGHLIHAGVKLFCPVAHSWPLVRYGKIDPIDDKLWHSINAPFVEACGVLIVARLEGWDASEGIADETTAFVERAAPIFDFCPTSLLMTRRA
jgi:hypothetical protein